MSTATDPIPLYDEKELFYVPAFEVRLSGNPLRPDVLRDVVQVTYRDNFEEIDSFELTVNNWDAEKGAFKYEPPSDPQYAKVFEPGTAIELRMGYRGNMRVMVTGEITTLEPEFPQSGNSILSVRGLNRVHKFRKKQHTWSWDDARSSDIAEEIGKQPESDDKPGLNFEVRVDKAARDREPQEPFVFMNNQYDIVFLMERARRHGYAVYLDRDKVSNKEFLHFGPSQNLREITYRLEWGKSLTQFRPSLTTANQISKVTVRGWDRRKKKAIEGTAEWGKDGVDMNRDQQSVALAVQGRHEVITDQPVHTEKQAKSLAKDILVNQLKEMVKASGATVGLPDLRAGRKLVISNIGPRFGGEYYVTDTTHQINDSGYTTQFNARREKGLS